MSQLAPLRAEKPRTALSDERRRAIANVVATTSQSYLQIGVAYDIAEGTVHIIAKQFGVNRRRRRRLWVR